MNKKTAFPAICFFLIFGTALCSLHLKRASATSSVGGKTLILYDTALGPILPFKPSMLTPCFHSERGTRRSDPRRISGETRPCQ